MSLDQHIEKKTKIIGLGHRVGVGKDTAAVYLEKILKSKQYSVARESFAYEMKKIAHQLYGWAGLREPEYYDTFYEEKDRPLPKIGMTVRQCWIGVGNRMRDVYAYTWVQILKHKHKGVDYLIVPDVRFYAEVEWVESEGGMLIRVDNPRIPNRTDGADDILKDFDRWHHLVVNDSDLVSLFYKLEDLVNRGCLC